MKKEDLFDDEFLKQFKSGEELSSFLKQLQKRGLEKMLEGELDGHLLRQEPKVWIWKYQERLFSEKGSQLLR